MPTRSAPSSHLAQRTQHRRQSLSLFRPQRCVHCLRAANILSGEANRCEMQTEPSFGSPDAASSPGALRVGMRDALRTEHDDLNAGSDAAALRRYLQERGPGSVDDHRDLESLLARCWDSLVGSTSGGMTSSKLFGRIEDARWQPPELTFTIERHGGTVVGSSRAELQDWTVDLERQTLQYKQRRHRQLRSSQPRLDVAPLAEEIFKLMLARADDARLTWNSDGSVQVKIGTIIPATSPQQTTTGRRKRFSRELTRRVEEAGGTVVRSNVYRLPTS